MRTVFRAALVVALLAFGLFSSYVAWEVGYLGIWRAGLANLGAMHILADLVIMGTLLLALLWRDARTPAVVQPTSDIAAFTLSTAAA